MKVDKIVINLNIVDMMKNVISSLLLGFCFLLFVVSCSKDSEEKEVIVELNVSSRSVTLDDNNNQAVVSVSSNTSWTASASDSWLSCTPSDGKNNQNVTISANGDNTSNAARTGSVTIKDNSGKKSITISVKQNVVLAPLDVVTDLMVPYTDGFATNVRFGKEVSSWRCEVFTKDFALSTSDSEIINIIKSYSPISNKHNIYTWHNAQNINWFVPNTDYYVCTVGVDSSGKYGNLSRRLFKTSAENLPLAEITKIELTSNKQWHCQVSLKNGASKFYAGSSQSVEIYNLDDYLIGFMTYKDIIEGTDVPTTNYTDGYWDYLDQQIVVCTWATNSTGKIGGCNVARSGSSKTRNNADYDVTYISSEICPQILGETYTSEVYEKWQK